MTFKNLLTLSAGTIGALALSLPAQAASFTGFAYNTTSTYANNPTEDIFLQSVSYGNKTISDFSLVTGATVIENDLAGLGPSSTDRGDDATSPDGFDPNEVPSAPEVVSYLGNLNLSNIIDTEEYSRSVLELDFDKKVNTFFIKERGMNSALTVEALDANGAVIDNFRIDQTLWTDAGYALDTTEIGFAQNVGSYGLKLDTAVSKVRIISDYADFGPDYKIVAAQVPEPGSMAALGLIGAAAILAQRRKQAA